MAETENGSEYGTEALETGVVLQSYEIQAILGKGGFGITYLAMDRNLKQQVALKEYFPHEVATRLENNSVAARSESVQAHFDWGKSRFLLEAQILAQFKHPNIVRVLTLFEDNNTAYMAMDFERGRSLADILEDSQVLDETALKAITLPLLSGLESLHAQGFIHRDIKPENIVIREDGSPVLIDFGSARNAMGQRSKALTTLLTPGYSPLEQYYSTSDDQGPWTDIYAFGGVLYRSITGNTPPESALRTSSALSGRNDPLVAAVTSGLGRYSRHFLEAVDLALRVLEKDRPQSVEQWRAMLFPSEDAALPEPKGLAPVVPVHKDRERPSEASYRKTEPLLLYVDDAMQQRIQQVASSGELPGSFENVLVLADDVEHVRSDCAKLAAAGCNGFKAFARGRQGLRYMKEHKVDLIICDASLRDMAGLSFLHHVGKLRPMIPVLLIAHSAERGYVLDAISLGAAGFLKRPIDDDDMQRQLLQLWQVGSFYGVEMKRMGQAHRLLAEGKLREARESFMAVTSIVEEPQDYYDTGFEELLGNQFGRAMVDFKRAAKILLLAIEAHKGLAEAATRSGDTKRSKGFSVRAARHLALYTRLEETKQLFVTIMRNKSHIPNPYNTLGVALRKLGDFTGASKAYAKALELSPDDPYVHYNMARVLASNLEHDQAVEQVSMALAAKPNFDAARQLYRVITGLGWQGNGSTPPESEAEEEAIATAPRAGNTVRGPEPLLDD